MMQEWAVRLKELPHDEWNKPFHLDELSERLGSLQDRVARVPGLIKGIQLSLTDIAYQCGFADQGNFTRIFKAITACLPKALQKL